MIIQPMQLKQYNLRTIIKIRRVDFVLGVDIIISLEALENCLQSRVVHMFSVSDGVYYTIQSLVEYYNSWRIVVIS